MGLGVVAYIRGGGARKLRGMIIGIWAVAKRGTPEHSGPKQGGHQDFVITIRMCSQSVQAAGDTRQHQEIKEWGYK